MIDNTSTRVKVGDNVYWNEAPDHCPPSERWGVIAAIEGDMLTIDSVFETFYRKAHNVYIHSHAAPAS